MTDAKYCPVKTGMKGFENGWVECDVGCMFNANGRCSLVKLFNRPKPGTANRHEASWLLRRWPRFSEDGGFVLPGNIAFGFDGPHHVRSIELTDSGWRLYGRGEPKVDPDEKRVVLGDKFVINEGRWGDTAERTYAEASARGYLEGDGE